MVGPVFFSGHHWTYKGCFRGGAVPIPTAVLRGSPVPQERTSPQAWKSGPQLLSSWQPQPVPLGTTCTSASRLPGPKGCRNRLGWAVRGAIVGGSQAVRSRVVWALVLVPPLPASDVGQVTSLPSGQQHLSLLELQVLRPHPDLWHQNLGGGAQQCAFSQIRCPSSLKRAVIL